MTIRQCPHFYGTIIEPDCYQMASAGILSHSQTETCLGDYENCALYQRAKAETAEGQESALLHLFGGPEFANSFLKERMPQITPNQSIGVQVPETQKFATMLMRAVAPGKHQVFPARREFMDRVLGTDSQRE